MKLSDVAKQFEECMEEGGPCLVKNCPLSQEITIKIGDKGDEFGQITWRVEGCSLMGRFQDWLKNKKPGELYQLPGGTKPG